MGFGPRVGSGYRKTRLEPDPLPFLAKMYLSHTFGRSGLDLFDTGPIKTLLEGFHIGVWVGLTLFIGHFLINEAS